MREDDDEFISDSQSRVDSGSEWDLDSKVGSLVDSVIISDSLSVTDDQRDDLLGSQSDLESDLDSISDDQHD